jgi:hypothetical protein
MNLWGVWCQRGDDPTYGWFKDSDGTPLCYHSESEVNTVVKNLKQLLPGNDYEARPMLENP